MIKTALLLTLTTLWLPLRADSRPILALSSVQKNHHDQPVKKGNTVFVTFAQVYDRELARDAILNESFPGFKEDYLLLHCLVRKYRPRNFFEIGTCEGEGTLIIKNAIGAGLVYSLELPPHLLQQTDYKFLVQRIGIRCYLPYIQCYGDSMTYNYTQHFPIEGWFIDGQHDYVHAFHESKQAILSNAHLIIWHDSDIPEVFQAIIDAFSENTMYTVFRVQDTRITYALRKTD